MVAHAAMTAESTHPVIVRTGVPRATCIMINTQLFLQLQLGFSFSPAVVLLLTCINRPLDSVYRLVSRQSKQHTAAGACWGFTAVETTSGPTSCLKRPVICHFSSDETLSLNVPLLLPPFSPASLWCIQPIELQWVWVKSTPHQPHLITLFVVNGIWKKEH